MIRNLRHVVRVRCASQRISGTRPTTPLAVVQALAAVQAQDYLASLWAIGMRLRDATEPAIEDAAAKGLIVRTWPLRGTLHWVASADVRWMLDLLAPRMLASADRRHQELGLTPAVFAKARRVVGRVLQGERTVTRPELYQHLEKAGVSTGESRGMHIMGRLAQEQLICFGPRNGKQPTFVLFDEWVPATTRLTREDSLARLATRYFTGHGPATLADFRWWSGLSAAAARTALELVERNLDSVQIGDRRLWFKADATAPSAIREALFAPAFDELTVGYQDRAAILDPLHAKRLNAGGGMLNPVLVHGERVVATWQRTLSRTTVTVVVRPFAPLSAGARREAERAAARYGRFLDRKATLEIRTS